LSVVDALDVALLAFVSVEAVLEAWENPIETASNRMLTNHRLLFKRHLSSDELTCAG
jgi:hypothetical protein